MIMDKEEELKAGASLPTIWPLENRRFRLRDYDWPTMESL
jgi:hypothetical protein